MWGGSNVDESLFGDSQAMRARKKKLQNAGKRIGNQSTDDNSAIHLTRREFEAIKARALDDRAARSADPGMRRKNTRVPNPGRKEIKFLPKKKPTVQEEYQRRRRQNGTGRANLQAVAMMDDQLDEVKDLKMQLNLMKVQTIRVEQVKEKEQQRGREVCYNAYWDKQMLEERDAAIYQQHLAAVQAKKIQKEYARTLIDQKVAMERVKILDEERVEQEKVQMKLQIKKMQEQEIVVAKKKVILARHRNEELMRFNMKARSYKQQRVREEKEEDQRIMKYLQQKEIMEERRVAADEAEKAEKARTVARLRALQERSTDKKAEEDLKRAKRLQEQRANADEAMYQKRIDDRKEMMKEVVKQRDLQVKRKAQRNVIQLKEDKVYMSRIAKEQAVIERRIRAEVSRKHRLAMKHAEELAELRDRRSTQAKQKVIRQKEEDSRAAMDSDVYDHRVKEVYARKMREHVESGNLLPPQYDRKQESQEEKNARRMKFQTSRALW